MAYFHDRVAHPATLTGRNLAACFLFAALPAGAQAPSAADLLRQAQAAFEHNLEQEKHWNWTTRKAQTVFDPAGRELQRLPDVTVESVIRQDGRRCNAVLSWGDGMPPYQLNADADARCSGQDPVEPPLRVAALLQSGRTSIVAMSPAFITVAIHHDKARIHAAESEVRCTASVEGIVRLDRATFFPVYLEGKIVDSGCESETVVEVHYEGPPVTRPARRALFKGTTFRMEFALQPDKYGTPANSYWISTAQRWSKPLLGASGFIYFNRRFELLPVDKNCIMLEESRTTAQEFGARSLTVFDSIPK